MAGFARDLVFAVRLLKQRPGFALAAILTLALGIGANATIYSLADAVLFRPLAVPAGDRVVHVYQRRAQPGTFPLSYADYFHYRDQAHSVESIAAHYPTAPLHVAAAGMTESVTGAVVTASYFDVLQLQPAAGRFFRADEDEARDRDAVAVIGHGYWLRRFGGDRSVLGSPLQINGRHFTVVGIAPRGFTGVHPRSTETDVWIPAAMFGVGYRYCNAFDRGCDVVQLLARLKPAMTVVDAQREFDVLAARLPADGRATGVTVIPARGMGQSPQSTEVRQMQLFVGVVLLALLLACANIAGLLLARFSARRRDIAVRLALGAGRGRVARQVLAESTVLAAAGGFAGLLVSAWGTDMLAALYAFDSAGRRVAFDLTLRGAVIAATLAVTALTALVAGLAPALQASRTDLIGVLKDENVSGGARRTYLRTLLVSVQVAVSVVLLVGAGLLIQSLRHAYQGPGFEPDRLVMLRLRPSLVNYSRERSHAFQREAIRALEALPGVRGASPSVFLPMFSSGERVSVAADASSEPIDAIADPVGPRYFSTIGLPLIEGREFTDQDRTGSPFVAVVNDVLARRLWPTEGGVGRDVMIGGRSHTVVGVVPDAQYYPTGDPPRPQVFFSYWQPHNDDAFAHDSRTVRAGRRRSGGDDACDPPRRRRCRFGRADQRGLSVSGSRGVRLSAGSHGARPADRVRRARARVERCRSLWCAGVLGRAAYARDWSARRTRRDPPRRRRSDSA